MLRRRVVLTVLVVGALLGQIALFPHLRVGGVLPDVMLLVVVVVSAREGPEFGTPFGFGVGLLMDLFLEVPAGLSALSYTLVGYGVGVAQSSLLRRQWWLAPVLGGVSSLCGGLVFVLAGIVVGQDYLVDVRTFTVIPMRAVYDSALALGLFPVAGRLLGPSRDLGVAGASS